MVSRSMRSFVTGSRTVEMDHGGIVASPSGLSTPVSPSLSQVPRDKWISEREWNSSIWRTNENTMRFFLIGLLSPSSSSGLNLTSEIISKYPSFQLSKMKDLPFIHSNTEFEGVDETHCPWLVLHQRRIFSVLQVELIQSGITVQIIFQGQA